MEITWYGLSCFRFSERGLASVVTDPYDHQVTGYESLKLKADIVTISHDVARSQLRQYRQGQDSCANRTG